MINADIVRNWQFEPVESEHSWKDTILYALGAGVTERPEDLSFVYEADLQALPTQAVVLAPDGFWLSDPRTGINWRKLLHGEQRLTLHAPLPSQGTLIGQTFVDGLYDRGEGRGAVLILRRELKDADTKKLIAETASTAMLMGDGGFGGSSDGIPRLPQVPETNPDLTVEMPTKAEQALIYRLSGDTNPLHIDPEAAKLSGFDRPILHGLCSYAVLGRAVLKAFCNNDPSKLKQLDVRFSRPVYPGETLVFDFWRNEDDIQFRARIKEREEVALTNGYAKVLA